jgi:hypothetical protein
MTPRRHKAVWIAALTMAVAVTAGIVTMYRSAGRYGQRLQGSLERALGRKVEFLTPVEFSLLRGPALYVEQVDIYEDPSLGIEPVAYVRGGVEVRPSLWSLVGGKFVISSIRLEDASINLAKSGPAAEWGRWNFAAFLSPSLLRNSPAIHVRNSRIHFKFGDEKSVFYLTETDLDVTPPGSIERGWKIECSAKLARTDRPALGLGSFTLDGRWFVEPERVDLDVVVDRAGLGELTALVRGESGSIHGTLSSRLHLGGPIDDIGIQGRLLIEDVHRWDLMPTGGKGWPLDIRGRLRLVAQQLELDTTSAGDAPAPLAVRFRASNYLTQPRWGVSVSGNRFPLAPLMELARHMGAEIPPRLQLAGTVDGVIGYSGEGGFQGELALHDAALTIPDSPPLRFDQAYLVVGQSHVRLAPALVGTANDQARIEADYAMDREILDLSISADAMDVSTLRAQVALAAVPWLEQVQSGRWSGQLHYRYLGQPQAPPPPPAPALRRAGARAAAATQPKAGWTGTLEVREARLAAPGLADPLELASAHAQIDGARVALDRVTGRAGKLAFTGDYRYEPAGARPHRVRLRAAEVDAADLEAEFAPALRRNKGLLAQAFGRSALPEWLRYQGVEGTLQIGDLSLAGLHFEGLRARLLWVAERVDLDGIQATSGGAAVSGRLGVNLRSVLPSYRLTAKLKGLDYLTGKLDAEGAIESFGSGTQLLTNLTAEGTFAGAGWDLGAPAVFRGVEGGFHLTWAPAGPRVHLTDVSLRDTEDTYTGNGATEENGHVNVLLSNGTREIRVSGPLARLRVEEAAKP